MFVFMPFWGSSCVFAVMSSSTCCSLLLWVALPAVAVARLSLLLLLSLLLSARRLHKVLLNFEAGNHNLRRFIRRHNVGPVVVG